MRIEGAARLGLLAALLLASASAQAQQSDAEKTAAAQALFQSAMKLMEARKFDEACPKLEEAIRLEPAGLGAKLRLAQCYEDSGRLASAWSSYLAAEGAATRAGQAPRAAYAREHAAALEPRLSRLVVVVPQSARVDGLEVTRDGTLVRPAQWGVPTPVDPGTHAVEATAPKKKPWKTAIDVAVGAREVTVTLVPLELAPEAPALGAAATPEASDSAAPAQGVPGWAWPTGAAGLALAEVAVGFLVDERRAQKLVDQHCTSSACDRREGFDPGATNGRLGRDFGFFIGFGAAGLAALGVATYAIVTAPKAASGKARVGLVPWGSLTGAGAAVGGGF